MALPTIRPLNLGTITRRKITFGYFLEPAVIIDAPLIAYYIEAEGRKILVDTGGAHPSCFANPHFQPFRQEPEQTLDNQLAKYGLAIDDIDMVIATHLHWDHCAENHRFTKAPVLVQEIELEAARNPFPVQHGYVKELIENVNYSVISGDQEVAPGVSVMLAPGHTYGMQAVLVEAEQDRYLIAGDTVGLFEALDRNPPLISGIYVDMKLYYETMAKITSLSATILPGHDIKVFDKEIYR